MASRTWPPLGPRPRPMPPPVASLPADPTEARAACWIAEPADIAAALKLGDSFGKRDLGLQCGVSNCGGGCSSPSADPAASRVFAAGLLRGLLLRHAVAAARAVQQGDGRAGGPGATLVEHLLQLLLVRIARSRDAVFVGENVRLRLAQVVSARLAEARGTSLSLSRNRLDLTRLDRMTPVRASASG